MGKNDGKDLLAISYAAASVLAEGKNAGEIGVLAAFFTVLGDSLALIAARTALSDDAAKNEDNTENPLKTSTGYGCRRIP